MELSEKQQKIAIAVCVAAIIGGLGMVFARSGLAGGQRPSESMIIEATAQRDPEYLKTNWIRWSDWIENAPANGADAKKIAAAKENLAKLEAIMREKGIDPAALDKAQLRKAAESEEESDR